MKNKYIIIDTETTGFHPYDGDELLQVSIIDTDGNVLFDEYFKPQHRTEWKEAEQVNGISPEMVADRPAISEKISEINAIIENSDTIIGYNTQFDIGFLKANGAIVPDDIDTIDVMEDFAENGTVSVTAINGRSSQQPPTTTAMTGHKELKLHITAWAIAMLRFLSIIRLILIQ